MEDRYGFFTQTEMLYIKVYKLFLQQEQKRPLIMKEKGLKILIASLLKETLRRIKKFGLEQEYQEIFDLFIDYNKSKSR